MTPRTLLLLGLAFGMSSSAFADCGDLAKRMFNAEIGGERDYIGKLPSGMKLSSQNNLGDNGIDIVAGTVIGLDVRNGRVYWHNGRVFMVIALIYGKDETDIAKAMRALLTEANTDFDPNPKLVPKGEYLRCTDGLVARVSRSQVFNREPTNPTPTLTMTVYNSKLKLRFECGKRPGLCANLPKGYLD